MKVKYDCIECLSRQTVKLATKLTDQEVVQKDIISYGLRALGEHAFTETAPYITALVYEHARSVTGVYDAFAEEKKLHNDIAFEIIEDLSLKQMILESADPFDTATRLCIAGNIIDFSVGYDIDEHTVHDSVKLSLETDIYGYETSELKHAVNKAKNILFLGDNAGEIVFDQLLISLLPKRKITYAVKGQPIVNDATMDDAKAVHLDKLVNVVSTGSGIQGTVLKDCHEAFKQLFEEADLIISKGQANYETLNEYKHKNTFFLLRAKCQSIADEIGCKKNEFVIIKP